MVESIINEMMELRGRAVVNTCPEIMFVRELSLIEDEDIRKFTIKCLQAAPRYFWQIPASSTGKYHPDYAATEGGLVKHVKMAVKFAEDLLVLEQHAQLIENGHKDMIYAALILHDICKKGKSDEGDEHTRFDHPILATQLLTDVALNLYGDFDHIPEFVGEIQQLIASHMGQWNTNKYNPDVTLSKPRTFAQEFVHMCDYLASRKYTTMVE